MNRDINYFRTEYKKQKTLEARVNSRVLVRPNVKKWTVILLYISFIILLLIGIVSIFLGKMELLIKIILVVCYITIIIEFYLRWIFIMTVKCYQHYAKEETRRRCKCIPSCSEYAILSLKQISPLILALLKIRKRLFKTCDEAEYKVDFPRKKDTIKYIKNLI